jgi:glycine C-acetyltransferase/8-amino-7-oxononanoate synthase
MVDDAHGMGALGPGGRGSVAEAGLEDEVDLVIGTLGKALGSYGAYACTSRTMAKWLVNTARTLIFSTALSPPAVAAAGAALELLVEEPRRVERLQRNARILKEALTEQGMATGDSTTQVLPLVVGEADDAVRVCEEALEKGIFAQAIRPPTVPQGSSRLRLAVMASHTRAELQAAASVLAVAMRKVMADRPQPVEVPLEALDEPVRGRIYDGLAEAA